MVVCKFFQQGNCRFGQNCRFEHVYGSKYTYHANAPAPAAPSSSEEQLLQLVHADVQAALGGGQWLLSSYAPFKEKPAFPGLNDLSFEEARLFIYEAKANNTLDQAMAHMNSLFAEARSKYEQLLLKNSNITRAIRALSSGENVSFSFGTTTESSGFVNNAASSVFRSAVQTPVVQNNQPLIFSHNNATSMFNQNNAQSIFAQANQSSFNQAPSVFSQAQPTNAQNVFSQQDPAKSIFAQASQSIFNSPTQNTTNPSDPANIFANASKSVFSQNQQPSPFSSQPDAFAQNNMLETKSGFGPPQNIFQQGSTADASFYSTMEVLSPEDIDAFNGNDFKMGFVPEVAPPQSFCF